jgi:putative drug exporter of the RND superfamily
MRLAGKRRSAVRPGSRLSGLSGLLIWRPRLIIGLWIVAVAFLAFVGRDLGDQLRPHPPLIDGSEAKRAHEITLRQFGSDESMVISLRGPAGAVERQGRRLAAGIDAQPKALVVSPWSPGGAAIGGLRPRPEVAGVVARIAHRGDEGITETLELIEGQIEEHVSAPVEANMAGLPRFFTSYTDANEEAAKTGELIAIPVLLIVLLLVFRSVIAALIPVIVGGVVVSATYGVMRLMLDFVQIESFALSAAGMMGLALGVDYALLTVSRFREESTKADLRAAVQTTVEASARSILPAAGGLILAMLVAAQILPGLFVSSGALAIVIATTLSAISALTAVPAAIMLLGPNLDRWTLPQRFAVGGTALRLTSRVVRSPIAVAAILLSLLFLSGWASTLDSALGTSKLLPPDDQGRVEEEAVREALGPGWLAPIDVVLTGGGDPMTSPRRLRSLVSFQERLEGDRGVQDVAGFDTVRRDLHPLTNFEDRLVSEERNGRELQGGLRRLHGGITETQGGAEETSDGIGLAASGADRLGDGVESSSDGAGLLEEGLRKANTGSERLTTGIRRASEGTGKLEKNTSNTSGATGRLAAALEEAQEQVGESDGNVRSSESALQLGNERLAEAQAPLGTAEARLASAWQALREMTTGVTDPKYAALQQSLRESIESLRGASPESEEPGPAPASVTAAISRGQRQFDLGLYLLQKIDESNDEAAESTEELAESTEKLDEGVKELAEGTTEVADGLDQLAAEGKDLPPALERLRDGTASLGEGLDRIAGNADGLADGLDRGAYGSAVLAAALSRLAGGLAESLASAPGDGPSPLGRLRDQAPGLFGSGYFYLAGLDGSEPGRRAAATFMIDIGRGGHTARMMVIPRHPITTAAGRDAFERVRDDARAFADSTGTDAAVGGLMASQLVLDESLRDRTTLARIAMMLITVIILTLVLRSLTMPVIAAFLNLLTVSASLGIASLLFNGSLLGGPGYVDSSVLPVAMMVIFGLAIDYEVFIFARMREEYIRTGSPNLAVDNGIERTGSVVTGAAVIMIAVLLCFSVSAFATMRDFGVIEATAVFIDAFIIRLVIVPAVMKAMGRAAWWMPRWLDRLLPGGDPPPVRERPKPAA